MFWVCGVFLVCFGFFNFYYLACMAVGAGDAGSRLSLCGAPLWTTK